MFACEVRTADEAYSVVRQELLQLAASPPVASRAGDTAEILGCLIQLAQPRQRWTSVRYPAMNPAFALVEVIWIVLGRRDSKLPNHWNPALPRYAGKGSTYHGAYGHRIAWEYGFHQLEQAYLALDANPGSRQVVLQIWHPALDFPTESGHPRAMDVPCNVTAFLKVRNDRLEWTQVMRSNDVLRGLPHNLVQWTSLQEIVSGWLGLEVGCYRHYSDSLHLYTDNIVDVRNELRPVASPNGDDLRLPKPKSDAVFACLGRALDDLANGRSPAEAVTNMAVSAELPKAYENWLVVIVADHIRRLGYIDMSLEVLKQCSNPCLKELMQAWIERMSAK